MSKEEDREDLDKRLDTIRSMFTIAQEEAEKVRKAAFDAADEAYNATLYWARRAKNYSGQLEIAKFKRKAQVGRHDMNDGDFDRLREKFERPSVGREAERLFLEASELILSLLAVDEAPGWEDFMDSVEGMSRRKVNRLLGGDREMTLRDLATLGYALGVRFTLHWEKIR